MGFDIATGAMVHQRPSYSVVKYVDSTGNARVFRAGESVARNDDHSLNMLLLADQFPVLMPLAFEAIHPHRFVVERGSDEWIITARLVRGQLFSTTLADGSSHEHDVQVVFRFSDNGWLTHRTDLNTGKVAAIQPAVQEDSLFVPVAFPNGWEVVQIETWANADIGKLSEARVLSFAAAEAMTSAEAQNELIAPASARSPTSPGVPLRAVVDQARSPSQQRWTWVTAGVVLVAVGLFAWWKRR